MWIWRGELIVGSIYIRPLTGTLLRMHFCRNFLLLRRHIQLDDEITEDERALITTLIDAAHEQWKIIGIKVVMFTYLIHSATVLIETL